MVEIPKQLQKEEVRFCKLGKVGKKLKRPFEKDWQNKGYKYSDPSLLTWIKEGGNYGVIGGYGGLIILDADDKVFANDLKDMFNTFTVQTGKGGNHFYILSDYNKNHVFKNEWGELRAKNYQAVGAGCIHPNGNKYEVVNDVELQKVTKEELLKLITPYLRPDIMSSEPAKISKVKDESRSGREFREIIKLIRNGSDKQKVYEEMQMYAKWSSAPEGYKELSYVKALKYVEDAKQKRSAAIFTRRGQLEKFWEDQPFYFDTSKIFYLWDKEECKWVIGDEVDFCNLIYEKLGLDTINSKERSELVEGFKQVGRHHKPKDIEKSWVQFKDKVYDVKTGECFDASPEYFITNPIPYKVGETEETPEIDKLFEAWVDKKNIQTLYEIIAYNIITDKFMQRLIALCGGGSNGKGTFTKLNYKFLGEDNYVTSEIKQLSEDKFEPAVMYKKLLCVAGEVSHNDLRNTNILKKLGGEDKISFQFKGKTPFTSDNSATFMCLTNSLPITPDKSVGFYRKWLIIDFPNQFKQINEDLIGNIPIEEFENLAKKCLRILKELYKTPKFTNEGDFDERVKRYEEHSNPIMRFINERCIEQPGEMTILRDFSNACNDYMVSKHLRVMNAQQIGKIVRDEGFIVGNRRINDISAVVILNLLINTTTTIKTIQKLNRNTHRETSEVFDSFDSNNSIVEGECRICGMKCKELTQDFVCPMCNEDIPKVIK